MKTVDISPKFNRSSLRLIARACLATAALASFCAAARADNSFTIDLKLNCNANTPCGPTNQMELFGTIVTDSLGALTASNVKSWDLQVGNSTLTPVHITNQNGSFTLGGGTTLSADANALTFTVPGAGASFGFSANDNSASWAVLGGAPAQLLIYSSVNGPVEAFSTFSYPGQFTATAFGATPPVPEPATTALMLGGLTLVGGVAARRRAKSVAADGAQADGAQADAGRGPSTL